MRSIAAFPTAANQRRRRTNSNDSNSSSSSKSPVWGRSAAAVVSSPGSSSIGSNRSSSRSPQHRQSPVWNLNNNRRSRSKSPASAAPRNRSMSPVKETISGGGLQIAPVAVSSSPRRTHRSQRSHNNSRNLCTIAEDRRISSNTLNKMTITTTAKQIARKSTLTITQNNNNEKQQQRPNYAVSDPYNDDIINNNDDDESYDCVDCWAYNKSRFKHWWFVNVVVTPGDSYSSSSIYGDRRKAHRSSLQ